MSDLSIHIETIARHYWGDPNEKLTSSDDIRFGTRLQVGCAIERFGLIMRLNWGGVVDLVRYCENLDSKSSVGKILFEQFGIPETEMALARSAEVKTYDYFDAQGL